MIRSGVSVSMRASTAVRDSECSGHTSGTVGLWIPVRIRRGVTSTGTFLTRYLQTKPSSSLHFEQTRCPKSRSMSKSRAHPWNASYASTSRVRNSQTFDVSSERERIKSSSRLIPSTVRESRVCTSQTTSGLVLHGGVYVSCVTTTTVRSKSLSDGNIFFLRV